ncbi:MAG: phosphatase PAP2 family protein [Gammaproteobacteria bacterium]|nr:phosphatase PAP2 family protein [Gammaproteobacteria bacterium]
MTPFNQLFKCMTKPWVIASYALLMVLLFLYFDKPIAVFFHDLKLGYLKYFLVAITSLGKSKPAIGLLFLLALLFRYIVHKKKWEMRAWFLWLCTLIPSVIVLGLKMLFGRARPELWFSDGLYGFQWIKFERLYWSFPSGHTATMMGLMFGLCVVWPRYRFVFLLFGFFVMLSRIVLFQHYVSDVMVSLYLTLIEVGILQWVLQRYAPQIMKEVHG